MEWIPPYSPLYFTAMAAELDKVEYFNQLYALKQSSQEEEDTNDLPRFPNTRPSSQLSSFPVPTPSPRSERRSHGTKPSRKVPGVHRTYSAPASSSSSAKEIKETPLIRKTSLLRYDISTPPSAETSFEERKPESVSSSDPKRPEATRRTVSDSSKGPLVLNNSTGITTMLQKKGKRKRSSSVTLVPEDQRIFQEQTFFYIPNDDIAPLRRARISKARNHGVTWAREFGTDVTHIIVDKALSYQDVMTFMKAKFSLKKIPSSVTLVNEEYPIDCIQFRLLVDSAQSQYAVEGCPNAAIKPAGEAPIVSKDMALIESSRPKSRKDDDAERHTPPQEEPTQEEYLVIDETPAVQRSMHPAPLSAEHSSPGDWLTMSSGEEASASAEENPSFYNPRPLSANADSLDEMIRFAQGTKDLPLDDDEDDTASTIGSPEDSEGSDDSREKSPTRAPAKKKRKGGPKGSLNQESFQCMKGGTSDMSQSNPNARTIEILGDLGAYYERIKDQWRTIAYRKAISTLRRQDRKICTYEEAIELSAIGTRLANKIQEIVLTDRLRRLEYTKLEPEDKILQSFLKIYGVGTSQAYRWIQQGHKSLDDLRARVRLTENQQIGIDHYDHFNTRIPRDEMDELGVTVIKTASEIDPDIEMIIGGSYRRGAKTSRDIDFIITKRKTTSAHELTPFLHTLVTHLTLSGFLVAALAVPGSHYSSGSKWHGACVLPTSTVWRRIDFLLVPETEFGAALIYFTGDDIFNRSMRLLSGRKGMRLNQRGLYKGVMRGPGRVKLTEGSLIEGANERKIFDALGVTWRPPEQRICH
ncbi:hypothetical protein B0J14DRAFT_322460 [Halenospora varia]|nr:hypothetical protein B0J14DRAFT_322460 [Halenospora varia]